MFAIEKMDRRYREDVGFKHVVDILQHMIVGLSLSPSEVREAAMFACYMVEMRRAPEPHLMRRMEAEMEHPNPDALAAGFKAYWEALAGAPAKRDRDDG